MIRSKVNFSVNVPNVNMQKELREIAERILIPRMKEYINRGVSVDGSNFPALEPATIRRKSGAILKRVFTQKGNIRAGVHKSIEVSGLKSFSPRTLIETGKLIASFYSEAIGKRSVKISLTRNRKKIGEALQIDGVGKKNKHFVFFGINPRMQRESFQYIKNRVNEILKNGKKTKIL